MKKNYHFLGIGGIGMSALAHILVEKGENVSGADLREPLRLKKLGISFTEDFPKHGTIIYSTAIKEDHPALLLAKKQNIPLMHRSDLLKALLENKQALLVTGTHGKTSTSALLAWVLFSAGLNPSYAVGGILQNFQKNGGFGSGPHFVAEADESDGSFLRCVGDGAIITNIEKEHLNYWKSEEKIIQGFQTFIRKVRDPRLLFWCADNPILEKLNPPGISYGIKGELSLKSVRQAGTKVFFTAHFEGKVYEEIELPLMGKENALNALAVFGMALQLGVSEKEVRAAFLSYKGVQRRLELLAQKNRITFFDDYAHHPTEISSTLQALKKGMGNRRLIALFQPHRYTRTKELDFTGAFEAADLAIITDIYSAGESPIKGVSGFRLFKKLKASNTLYLSKDKLLQLLPKMLVPGDVFLTIGAGDITEFGPKLFNEVGNG